MKELLYLRIYCVKMERPITLVQGKGNRAYKKGNRLFAPPPKDRIIKLKQNITEEEAFKHEIYMISVFGRKDLGQWYSLQ